MILDDDDSLKGSIIVLENPIIEETESKSIYKSGIDHRFYENPESRFRADKPLIALFKKSNKWRSVPDIVRATGMAERTVQYTCRRFIKHEIFEETKLMKSDTNHRRRYTRLYRLITKSKNDTRKNPRKYENHKKRQSRSNR